MGTRITAAEATRISRERAARRDPQVAHFLGIVYDAVERDLRREVPTNCVDDPFAGLQPGPDTRQLAVVAGALAADGYRVAMLESMPPKLVVRWGDPGDTDGDGA